MNKFEVILGDASFAVSLGALVQNRFNPERNIAHFHIDNEIHVVFSGSVTMELDSEAVTINGGEVCIVGKNIPHYYKSHTESFDKTSLLLSLSRVGSPKGGFSEYEHYGKIFGAIDRYAIVKDIRLTEICNELASVKYTEESEHIYKAHLAVFFIILAGIIERRLSSGDGAPSVNHKHRDDYGQKSVIEDFFHTRYNENVTIEDLSRVIYKSVPQTHRIVKQYYGDNFKRILIKQRIEHACMLLLRGEITLGEIATLCGYGSYNGFSSAFKKYTGKTPEEYKRLYAVGKRE